MGLLRELLQNNAYKVRNKEKKSWLVYTVHTPVYLIDLTAISPFSGQLFQLCLTSLTASGSAPFDCSYLSFSSFVCFNQTRTRARKRFLPRFPIDSRFPRRPWLLWRRWVSSSLCSRPSVQICLRVQRDFLICVTNTNAFKAPAPFFQPHTL